MVVIGAPAYQMFHSSPFRASFFCCQLSYWPADSTLTFSSIHTIPEDPIILATLNGGHEGYSPGPGLSQSIILQSLSSASGDKASSMA